MYIAALTEESKIIASAREHGMKDTHFAWTRRIIALSAIFSIIVLPKVAALVAPIAELPWLITVGYTEIQLPWLITVGYTEIQGGFWNWLFGPEKLMEWRSFNGFVITPLDTNLVAAITGLYFGTGFTKK
jgi:hypothetical protein